MPCTGQHHALRVAVVGVGAFGRNHLRIYRTLGATNAELVACVDPDVAVREAAAGEYGIAAFASVQDLLASGLSLDAASVCTPTVAHADAAVALLSAGVDVLIEKPIAPSLEEADTILAAAAANGRLVQVGHLERFNPAVTAVLPLRNRPMFFEAHRLSIFTPRSLDVDVVLDLMIHDLDIVLTLAASPVREVRAVGLPVLSRKTDIANVRVEFESGAVANFTASRVSTERVRKLRFFQPHQYLSLDFARQDVLMIDVTAAASLSHAQIQALFTFGTAASDETHTAAEVEAHLQAIRSSAAVAPQGQSGGFAHSPVLSGLPETGYASGAGAPVAQSHPSQGLTLRKVPTEPGEPLRLEIESFLHAVRTRETPAVSGSEGRAALALALQVNEAIAAHAIRAGLLEAWR